MAKKDKKVEKQTHKSKPIKSLKPKNKEMFTELKTHEENKINKFKHISHHKKAVPGVKQMEEESYEEEYNGNTDVKDAQSVEEMSAAIHQLLIKNKINVKNAFEVPLVDLEKLKIFDNISNEDNGWKKLASTLESDSKIYSYRVDAIHSIAYKIMNTMARNQDEDDDDKNKRQSEKSYIDEIQALRAFPIYEGMETSTAQLQKNIEGLNVQQISQGLDFNPSFERNKRKFDQAGSKSMLMNTIPIDNNLQLSLNESRDGVPSWLILEEIPVAVDELLEPLVILKQIENIHRNIYEISGEEYPTVNKIEGKWRKIANGEFQREGHYQMQEQQAYPEIGEMVDENEYGIYKKVEDAVKIRKNNKKISSKSAAQFEMEEKNWLTEIDKKMLGYKNTGPTGPIKKPKMDKSEDDIDFEGSLLKKEQVLAEWLRAQEKNQYDEEIEDRHLLPPKPFNKFKVEEVMTLREQPINYFQPMMDEQENIQLMNEKEQVDLRRQQISIRQSKQTIKSLIGKQTNFMQIIGGISKSEQYVSQQLCFLTILHLANQNNLCLEQSGQTNFLIK